MRLFLLLFLMLIGLTPLAKSEKCRGKTRCQDGSTISCEQDFDGLAGEYCRVEPLGSGAIQCTVYNLQDQIVGQPHVSLCWDDFDIDPDPEQ